MNADVEGAQDVLGEDFYRARRKDLEGRVKKKRLRHIDGVADTCSKLARIYGTDIPKARLAGLLHDWDKGYDDEGIRSRVSELGMEGEIDPFVLENMPQVLHGPTAAKALQAEYPSIPEDVIVAIRDHTTSSADADDLSKILYIADAIEPSRRFEDVERLRDMIGREDLSELYFQVYRFWTLALLSRGKVLHPDTMAIWNSLAMKRRDKDKEDR